MQSWLRHNRIHGVVYFTLKLKYVRVQLELCDIVVSRSCRVASEEGVFVENELDL